MNKDRVILVYPSNQGESVAPDRPPLGLLTVAAPLVEKGFDVCLLDERAEKEKFDTRLAAELKKEPICVGISSMSGRHIAGALRVSKIVKEQSKVPVVWGGVHPSLEPESTARHHLIDVIVRDDGEETFPELLAALKNKAPDLNRINGIGFKDSRGNVVLTEQAPPYDINKLPYIPYYLADLDKYVSREPWMTERGLMPMETSRGCPFSCSFCTESVRKKKWRALPPERVLKDLKYYISRYGVHSFTFIDDNMFGNTRRGEQLIDLLLEEKIDIQWYTNIRTDYMAHAHEDFIRKMERSGCRMLTFGAESGSERILKMINKYATKENVLQTNIKLRQTNIMPHYVTIRGFPTETWRDMLETFLLLIQLVLDNKKAICDSPFLIPTPGTLIFRQCFRVPMNTEKQFSLEEWAEAFNLEDKEQCPPWLEEKVYKSIKRRRTILSIVRSTNRKTTPRISNFFYRIFLRFAWAIIRLRLCIMAK